MVDIGGRQVVRALMVSVAIVVIHEGADLSFEAAGQVVVLQQHTVFHRLMPTLDLALGLGMVWRPADVIHALGIEIFSQIGGNIG
jgi:hypothetical protein